MKKSNSIEKLFSVLVMGGVLMAGSSVIADETEKHCQQELVLRKYTPLGDVLSSKATCLDGKSDDEVLTLLAKNKEDTCLSPFCGCWLG